MLKLSDLRKHRHDDEDIWPISMADMMTLLLCFFLLIVAVSHVDLHRYERVADSMQQAMIKGKSAEPKAQTTVAQKTPPPAPQPPAMRSQVTHTTLTSEPVPPLEKKESATETKEPEKTAGPATAEEKAKKPETPEEKKQAERTGPTRKSLEDIRKELAGKLDIKSGAVEIVPRDNGVELNLHGAAFFDLASAEIKTGGLPLLRDIAATLAGTPYKVIVEGHTDDLPIESWLYPSNWELSSARASRVARLLIDNGVPRDHIRVEGLADTHPLAPNRDAQGNSIPENQAKNRRVVILVTP